MTDDTVTKIAALVSELGKLFADCDVPTPQQSALIRTLCSPQHGMSAVRVALGVAVECTDHAAAPLYETILMAAASMAPLHKSGTMTRAELLRSLADSVEQADKMVARLRELMGKLTPGRTEDPPSNPGAN